MARRICAGMLFFWCAAGLFGRTEAVTFNGRLTASAYTWRVEEIDGSSARHLRLYQSVIANVRQVGGHPVSLHTYAQVSGDLGDQASGQHDYRIYHAYLRVRPQTRVGLDVSAGRQRIYGGVGYGTIDGVRVSLGPRPEIRLNGYVGLLVPLVPDDGIGTWDEGHVWGGQALFTGKLLALGVSFTDRSRQPLAYTGPGRFSGLVLNNSSQQFRRIGVDVRREFVDRGEVYGRLDLDAEDFDVQELEVMGHLQASPDVRLSVGFQHQEPTLYLNSILSVFEVSTNQEVEGRVYYRMTPLISLSAEAAHVVYDDDSSWRIGIGMMVGNGYIGYSRRLGYGGENDAFSATFQQPLSSQVTLKVDGSVAGYRLYEEQPERDQALAGALGLTFRPQKGLSFDVEGQVLRNKYYARDFRLFLRGSFWFFKRNP